MNEAIARQDDEFEADAPAAPVAMHPRAERNLHLRTIEALLFAAAEPLGADELAKHLPQGTDVGDLLAALQTNYETRGVNLVQTAGKWAFRTASDMSFLLRKEATEQKKLSKAGLETLAIVAYHQPVSRAEIEDIRGVAISKGTLDALLEIGWVKMRGRRRTPGRPVTYGTTDAFLAQFGLNEVTDLPGLAELKAQGLLDQNVPPGFDIPMPRGGDELTAQEDPLDGNEAELDFGPLEMHLPDAAEEPQSDA